MASLFRFGSSQEVVALKAEVLRLTQENRQYQRKIELTPVARAALEARVAKTTGAMAEAPTRVAKMPRYKDLSEVESGQAAQVATPTYDDVFGFSDDDDVAMVGGGGATNETGEPRIAKVVLQPTSTVRPTSLASMAGADAPPPNVNLIWPNPGLRVEEQEQHH